MRILPVVLVGSLMLSGCAMRPPAKVDNACTIYQQNSSIFNSWERQTKKVERQYGVPAPILLATIRHESSFHPRARPPRRRLLGFIPWKRPSSAFGYAQALDGTWYEYKQETGRKMARRSRYKDAVHFVGWYHDKTHRMVGVSKADAYSLYLAYYAGRGGFARGQYSQSMANSARRVANTAQRYDQQLRSCNKR
ncbi:MAG TPA: transglycosylase SLT domain-containing protein [Alcanivoracaceae bacterium]|nr:transglycosylase SLT domain-containing protein [Alcanivoracaceae bacterium]